MALYYYDVQTLRFISLLIVIIYHLGINRTGFIGVDIFFVISGFIMTYQYKKLNNYMLFVTSRIRRLFPSAYTILTFYYFLNINEFAYMEYKHCIFFTVNTYFNKMKSDYFHPSSNSIFLHYWSLSVEMKYYLFCPIILSIISFYKYILQSYRKLFIYFNLVSRLYEFNTGIFSYYSQISNSLYVCKLVLCFIILVISNYENNIFIIPITVLISNAYLISRVEYFRFYLLEYIGNISYIVYLIHYPLTIVYKKNLFIYILYLMILTIIFNYIDGLIQSYFRKKNSSFIYIIFILSIFLLLTVSKYMLYKNNRNSNQKNDYILREINIYNNYKCFVNNMNYKQSVIVIGDSHSLPLIGLIMNFCENRKIYLYYKYIHTQYLLDYDIKYLEDINTTFCLVLYTNYLDRRYHRNVDNYTDNTERYFIYLLKYTTKILFVLPTPVLYKRYDCSSQIQMKSISINTLITNYINFTKISDMKRVIMINITKHLCNISHCRVTFKNKCLYRDKHHINDKYFKLYIHYIIDISKSICNFKSYKSKEYDNFILYKNKIHGKWHLTIKNCKVYNIPVTF